MISMLVPIKIILILISTETFQAWRTRHYGPADLQEMHRTGCKVIGHYVYLCICHHVYLHIFVFDLCICVFVFLWLNDNYVFSCNCQLIEEPPKPSMILTMIVNISITIIMIIIVNMIVNIIITMIVNEISPFESSSSS